MVLDIGETIILNTMDDPIPISLGDNRPTPPPAKVNFGGGLELLMNSNNKKSSNTEIDLCDISDIEMELNKLDVKDQVKGRDKPNTATESPKPLKLNMDDHTNDRSSNGASEIDLGKSTAGSFSHKEAGTFKKFNNIPIDPDKEIPVKAQSPEALLKDKFILLRKLDNIESKGGRLTKKYSMESDYLEMKGEYEMLMSAKSTSNSINFQGKCLMAAISGIEFLNKKIDPFDIKLDGWGEQVSENLEEYDDIFAELHDKWSDKVSVVPELKLLMQLSGSAIMIHMTNSMFSSSTPGVDEILRQNPDILQQVRQATVNSVGQSNPGFGNYLNDVMNSQIKTPPHTDPVKTRVSRSEMSQVPTNRPDMAYARTKEGVDVYDTHQNVGPQPPVRSSATTQRPDMKGPGDIGAMLSGLKTKSINVPRAAVIDVKDDSTVSIQDLKDMTSSKIPSRATHRKKSERTSISLDI